MEQEENTTPNKPTEKQESLFKEVIKFSIIALLIVIPIRLFIAQPFIVSGASMQPTFESGEYLIVDQLGYRFTEPERGEVIIFRYPEDTSKFFIKRIVGLPGETVEIRGSAVQIVNTDYPEGLTLDEEYLSAANLSNDFLTVSLDNDEYFVLGDNRRASSDSRIWGTLKGELIIGRAFVRLLPVTGVGIFPGDHSN